MKIESTDQDIRNLLSSGYYHIPRFQRPYSWTRENIQEFWDDIFRDNPSDYFIGSMVVFKEGNQRYGVVDGQQRLTTITILLAALRNILKYEGFQDLAGGIHGLIERRNIDNKLEFILSTETSYPFFQDHILKWGTPDVAVQPMREEENLKGAFDQLNSLIGKVVESIKTDSTLTKVKCLSKIREKLLTIRDSLLSLKVIFVKLDSEDDAYIIFETLNTRGKDLSLTDLVKNHVAKHLKSKSASIDQTKIKWEQILETIEGSTCDLNTDAFIHHFWLSKYDYFPAKSLFKEIKRKIDKQAAGKFLDNLVTDSKIYRSIHDITYGKWSKQERRIADSLNALQLFRVEQQTPCVLSLVRAYNDKKIKKRHLEDALLAIEKFHFFFTAVTSQRSSGGISGMYASLGRRLSEAANVELALKIIKELRNKLHERIPSLEEVKALFPEIVYTDNLTKQRNLIRYILINIYKQQSLGIPIDWNAVTIEHVIPQSGIGTEDLTENIVGQLGNLILVSSEINEKLKNRSFGEKKKILIDAKYQLPDDISSASKWTKTEIVNRTARLAELSYNTIWKI